jgi:hypothetical protein
MAVYPTAKPTVAPAPAPAEAAPSVVVKSERKLEFMPDPVAPQPSFAKKHSARVLAEHQAGAEALANYQ